MRDRVQCQSAGKWQPGDLTRSDRSSVVSDTGTVNAFTLQRVGAGPLQ